MCLELGDGDSSVGVELVLGRRAGNYSFSLAQFVYWGFRAQGRGSRGGWGAARPLTLEQEGGVALQLWSRGACPPILHVGTSGIGDGLPYKVFHNVCYKLNQNFAVKS